MTGGSLLALSDLRFSYAKGGEELYGGLDHTFRPAAVTAITGASGRGKSTLLYLAGLMLRPRGGAVLLDGSAISDLPDAEACRLRARRFGFVFQDASLDPTCPVLESIIEPALYAGRRRREAQTRAVALLERFGLAARATHRPGQVSGGQAQRLAVCRALVNDPAVILADEPTGNLDLDNASLVLDSLDEAAHQQGCTVVIATHDPRVWDRADEVLTL